MKRIHTFESFLNESENSPKKYLLLIWDTTANEAMPELMTAFTSDNEKDLDIPKGELADMIEKTLNIKIDVEDFESEKMSYTEFLDNYANPKNPNRVSLGKVYQA